MNSSSTSSSESRFGRKVAAFLAGASLVLVVLYQIGGYGRKDGNTWFRALPPPASGDTLEVLFIGSSRVAAAVDPATFDSVASIAARRPVRSFNLGMGFSTYHEVLFALREMGRDGGLRNRLVLLEAPGGLPRHARWDDPWFEGDTRIMLSRYMRPGDLPLLWREAKLDAGDKTLATVEVLTGWQNNFWRLRTVLSDRTRGLLDRVGALFRPQAPVVAADPVEALVFARGGIRLDASRIGKIRESAIEFAAAESADPRPWTGWDSTLLPSIVQQIRAGGGDVGLFEMPVCSYQRRVFESPRRREGAVEFAAFRRNLGLAVVPSDTLYGDESFPDLWHLGIPAALSFSRRLGLSFLDASFREGRAGSAGAAQVPQPDSNTSAEGRPAGNRIPGDAS